MAKGQAPARRGFIKWSSGAAAALGAQQTVKAHHTETHFEDGTSHKMLYQCNKADIDYLQHILFSVGERVKIVDGPFANFTGVVDEILPDKGKLRVKVEIFGQATPVELDYLQVASNVG